MDYRYKKRPRGGAEERRRLRWQDEITSKSSWKSWLCCCTSVAFPSLTFLHLQFLSGTFLLYFSSYTTPLPHSLIYISSAALPSFTIPLLQSLIYIFLLAFPLLHSLLYIPSLHYLFNISFLALSSLIFPLLHSLIYVVSVVLHSFTFPSLQSLLCISSQVLSYIIFPPFHSLLHLSLFSIIFSTTYTLLHAITAITCYDFKGIALALFLLSPRWSCWSLTTTQTAWMQRDTIVVTLRSGRSRKRCFHALAS